MPTLKFKSKMLRNHLSAAKHEVQKPILVISASEFSVYPSEYCVEYIVSFNIKSNGEGSNSSGTSGPPTTMRLDLEMILKFLESASDDNDTVIIKFAKEPKVISFKIDKKPEGAKLRIPYEDVVNAGLGFLEVEEKDCHATVTLSRRDFQKGCEVLVDATRVGPTSIVNISVTVEGIMFSARGQSVLYKPNEVISWNMRNPTSFNLRNELLGPVVLANFRADSVTISAYPSIPLRLEFNVQDTLYYQYDILQQPELDALAALSVVMSIASKQKRQRIRRDLDRLGVNVDPFKSPPRDN